MVLELPDDVIGNLESLSLSQLVLQSADNLASPSQGEGDRVLQHFPTGHPAMRTQRERQSSRYG